MQTYILKEKNVTMVVMRIVIIGGGFGGVYTAGHLNRLLKNHQEVEIILINKTNYFLFTPLLHEVATGSLSPASIAEPLREIFRKTKVKFYQGEATKIDEESQTVYIDNCSLTYDYLVLATGTETHLRHIDHKEIFELKNLKDAINLRNQIIDVIENANHEKNPHTKDSLTNFVIVGAGATGVELSAELSDFIYGTIIKKYYPDNCTANDIKIYLLHSDNTILSYLNSKIQKYATKILKKKNIVLKTNTKVESIYNKVITLDNGETIKAHTTIWTAGVIPNHLYTHEEKIKRIAVNDFLQTEKYPNIFVVGDIAKQESPAPMLAQVATQEAKTVANNILALIKNKNLKPFKFKSQGTLLSLGSWRATGEIFGIHIHGRFTWWLWRTVYLFKFLSWRKRFRIMLEWTINLFFPRDITKA
ncbi:MAG TPA: NAD(P)/FAD-dependent oxidoreductase [Candidatus Paceibacterota bacterium]